MRLIATFFSHFDAVAFRKSAGALGISVRLTPVPRRLSSSCGTCARFEAGEERLPGIREMRIEALYAEEGDGYRLLWKED